MIGLRDVQELVHAQMDPIIAPTQPFSQDPPATPSYGLQPLPLCPLGCTPLDSYADDSYTVADAPLLTHAVGNRDQYLRATGMRLHMGKLKVWCPAGKDALPPRAARVLDTEAAGSSQHNREESCGLGAPRHRLCRSGLDGDC